jgi:DNA-binding IclR family transcriptional regulator
VISGTLNRGLATLELLAAHSTGMAIREIAAASGIPASATHPLLSKLVQRG